MAKVELYDKIPISTSGSDYNVVVAKNILADKSYLSQLVKSSQVLLVTNDTVAPLYLETIVSAYIDKACSVVILADGEQYKTQASANLIYEELVAKNHHRDTTIIALGGGVVGDIAGFVASTYQRGVACIHIPTTLLAQVDASVGGKTGINHRAGKNLIGSFYHPDEVVIDINTLKTLSAREFNSGIAEIIKYSLLVGGNFYQQLAKILKEGLTPDHPLLAKLIAQCCTIKAEFVREDEKEKGQRALLNLGHTFAHALETISDYKRWLHGEAVAIGLYCAMRLSQIIGNVSQSEVLLLEELLSLANLPHKIPKDIEKNQLMELMKLDKKVEKNTIRFVLIRTPGDCYLDASISKEQVYQMLAYAYEGENK